jgi:hypothetical protein
MAATLNQDLLHLLSPLTMKQLLTGTPAKRQFASAIGSGQVRLNPDRPKRSDV